MRRSGDNAKRLSNAERLDIRRSVAAGETFEAAAMAVGCSTKSIQRVGVGFRKYIRQQLAFRNSHSTARLASRVF